MLYNSNFLTSLYDQGNDHKGSTIDCLRGITKSEVRPSNTVMYDQAWWNI